MTADDTTIETIETAAPAPADKPAKPAKRAPAEKAAKKRKPKPPRLTKAGAVRAAKAAAAKEAKAAQPRFRYRDDQIISVLNLDNPRRPGTPRFDRYEVIKKFRGKSVGKFKAGGGDTLALRYAAKQMHVSVE